MSLGVKAAVVAVLTVVLFGLKVFIRKRRRERAARLRAARAERSQLHASEEANP